MIVIVQPLRHKGAFICSGIIEERMIPVLKKMEQLGFDVIKILTQEDWVSIACKSR